MNMTPCFVSDDSGENTRALLIGFYQKAWTHGASIAIGGFPAGQVAFPVAVVLLESGDVVTVDAKSVTIDAPEEIFSQYAWTGEVNDQSVSALNTCDNCNYAREVTMLDGSRITVCDGQSGEIVQVNADDTCDDCEPVVTEHAREED